VLAQRIVNGRPDDKTFSKAPLSLLPLQEGQLRVRTVYVSLEPHTIKELEEPSATPSSKSLRELIPLADIGATVPGYVLGQVVESRDPTVSVGEAVQGYWGWQTETNARVAAEGEQPEYAHEPGVSLVTRTKSGVRPVSYNLHILGNLGITGYIGLMVIGQPKSGDTVFVSSAAGNVGGVAGQTAKNLGCRVVGSVGSAAKAAYIVDVLGFDAAVNYKDPDLEARIDETCPDGIDIYYDNVGGKLSDLVIQRLRPRARVILCGATADWKTPSESVGPHLYWPLIATRSRVEGYYVGDYPDRYEDAYRQVAQWVREGRLTPREVIVDGFDILPTAYADFLSGCYSGKVLVRVVPEPEGWR
jgi:NADPH-dependent curcumin reductase CurA